MAKTKMTDIRYEVTGYVMHNVDNPVVRVVVSGTYAGQNLKGLCLVNFKKCTWRDPIETVGDGRYSFMIGGHSLYHSDSARPIIIKEGLAAATAWQDANPKALHVFLVEQARLKVEKYQKHELQARTEMDNANAAWRKAVTALDELEGQD